MTWMMAASFGMQLLGGMSASKTEKGMREAQGIIDRANADAANLNRDSQKRVSAAMTSLNSYTRSLNNQRAADAGGAKINALRTNVQRAMDQMATGNTQQQLQASEQMGQVSAMASAAGVGGSSVDIVKRTMTLRRNMQEQQLGQVMKATKSDFEAAQSAAIGELVGSQDMSVDIASMDYGVSQPTIRAMPNVLSDTIFNPKLDWSLLRDASFSMGGSSSTGGPMSAPGTYGPMSIPSGGNSSFGFSTPSATPDWFK